MRGERRWVTWRYVWREGEGGKPGKWDKPPFVAGEERGADSTDPSTWRTFEEAVAAYSRGFADGVGFVLGDGWVGFDSDEGAGHAAALDTYTETSPSGRGVHAIARGRKPGGRCRVGPYELYDRGRYLTVTGRRTEGSREEVEERTAQVAALYATLFPDDERTPLPAVPPPRAAAPDDGQVLALARAAKNGRKFAALWAGDASGHGSHSEADGALAMILAYWCNRDPFQVDRLFRQSGLMREKWDERRGELTYGQITVKSACENVAETHVPAFELNDVGNAEFFAAYYARQVSYDARRARWLIVENDSGLWLPDPLDRLRGYMAVAMRARRLEADAVEDAGAREAAWKWAQGSLSTARLNNLTREARTQPAIANDCEKEPWDADPAILGVPGGVVDLRTGTRRKAEPRERVTMRAGAEWDPDARSPLWERALLDIADGDRDWVAYVQRLGGYTATGDVSQDKWFIKHGARGREGKGTIDGAWTGALGDYALELPSAVFELRPRGNPDFDLSYLPRKRFVLSSETGNTIHLHHDRIKHMTGGGRMRVANKNEKSYEFEPSCKLWLACNDLPTVTDDSAAFWARVLVVPFRRSFLGKEDAALRPTLQNDPAHRRAVLAWLVKGAIDYFREGLGDPPKAVREATESFRDVAWPLTPFVREDCVAGPGAHASVGDFNLAYQRHCERQGVPVGKRLGWKRVLALMEARHPTYATDETVDGRRIREKHYDGIGLREPVRRPEDF
jgi:putative DNA primase/helicase